MQPPFCFRCMKDIEAGHTYAAYRGRDYCWRCIEAMKAELPPGDEDTDLDEPVPAYTPPADPVVQHMNPHEAFDLGGEG